MVPTPFLLSFDVNSVAETLTTHTYQELAFCGPNNDFIAHNNPSSLMFITSLRFLPHSPHGVAAVNTVIVAKMKRGMRNYLLQPLQWDLGFCVISLLLYPPWLGTLIKIGLWFFFFNPTVTRIFIIQ